MKLMQLKNGVVIAVIKESKKHKIFHGINLESPNLRVKNFKATIVELPGENTSLYFKKVLDSALRTVKKVSYNTNGNCKHHTSSLTEIRLAQIKRTIDLQLY